jgi:hypothetical protein
VDNLNNGFQNPNAPSNGGTQNSYGGVNPIQPQYSQTNSVNDVATQNPVMDPMANQPPVNNVNPVMDNPAPAQAPADDSYQADLDALKALADELNAVQATSPAQSAPAPLSSSDIEVTTPVPSMDMGTPAVDSTVTNTFSPSPVMDTPVVESAPTDDFLTPPVVETPVVNETPIVDISNNSPTPQTFNSPAPAMDVDALGGDPWDTSSQVVQPTPNPVQPAEAVMPSVDSNTLSSDLEALSNPVVGATAPTMDSGSMNGDLNALNNAIPSDMSNSPTQQSGITPTLETPVQESVASPSPVVDSAPAFANMPSDLSKPIGFVEQSAPIVQQSEELPSEDIVNTLVPKEEGKEGNVLIIVLVVLIVALVAAIGYFAYQIFLS